MINQTKVVSILPQRWVDALRKEKKLTAFCKYFYRDAIPPEWKGRGGNVDASKKRDRMVMNRLSHLVTNCQITECFNIKDTTEGEAFWKDFHKNL